MSQANKSTMINLERGKIPPQAVDMEEVVVGAMMIDQKGLMVIDFLKPDHFYKDAHRLIYEAIISLFQKKEPIDLLTVSSELKKQGNLESVGGDFQLIKITQKVASSAHIEYHARIIIQKAIQRLMIKASNQIIEDSYDETKDVFDTVDDALSSLTDVTSGLFQGKESKVAELVPEVLQKGIDIKMGKVDPGIGTPITNLTDKTGGWRNGELIILAARPGMGKTSLALSCCIEPAKLGIPTAFFSLEMSKIACVSRIISIETGIDGRNFNSKGLTDENIIKIQMARDVIDAMPMYIEDTPSLSIDRLRIKLKKMIIELKIKLAVLDYLQLMSGTGKEKNREQEISNISRGLKVLSLELGIPIIALSQLSRGVESRKGAKRPLLSDLRESGAIEQDADMVMFIYRPEYYGDTQWDDYNQASCVGEAEYLVAKNRNGGLTRNRMKFDASCTKFSELEEDFDAPDDLFTTADEGDDDDLPF